MFVPSDGDKEQENEESAHNEDELAANKEDELADNPLNNPPPKQKKQKKKKRRIEPQQQQEDLLPESPPRRGHVLWPELGPKHSDFPFTGIFSWSYEGSSKHVKEKRKALSGAKNYLRFLQDFLVKNGLDYSKIAGIRVTLSHKKLAQKDWIRNDCDNNEEVEETVETYGREFSLDGHEDIMINFNTIFPKPPPASSQPRQTSTKRKTDASNEARRACEESGDFSSGLREKWTCKQTDCRNYSGHREAGKNGGGYCYWPNPASNNGYSHLPLSNEAIKQWTKEIRDGDATHEVPPASTIPQLLIAKTALQHKGGTQKKLSQPLPFAGMPAINIYYDRPPQQSPPRRQRRRSSPIEPPSSQPSETAPDERVTAFFLWVQHEVRWKGLKGDLDDIKWNMRDKGFDVEGMKKLSLERWLGWNLKEGQHEKFCNSVSKWLSMRKEDRHKQREGSEEEEEEDFVE
jgi:hypothetical protein